MCYRLAGKRLGHVKQYGRPKVTLFQRQKRFQTPLETKLGALDSPLTAAINF
jgi:hypothetical protein